MSNLLLSDSHDLIVGRGMTRIQAQTTGFVAQLVKCRLLSLLGEWELDTTIGVDWFSLLSEGSPSALAQLELVVRNTITSTYGVRDLVDIELTPTVDGQGRNNRGLAITFRATSIYDDSTIKEVVSYGWSYG